MYALMRQLGQPISVRRTTSDAFNADTGIVSQTLVKARIQRALILATKDVRSFAYPLSFIAANKNFTYGGYFDESTRVIVFEQRELPTNFPVDLNMHVVFGGMRYELKEISKYPEFECLILVINATEGVPVLDQVDVSVVDVAAINDGINEIQAITDTVVITDRADVTTTFNRSIVDDVDLQDGASHG